MDYGMARIVKCFVSGQQQTILIFPTIPDSSLYSVFILCFCEKHVYLGLQPITMIWKMANEYVHISFLFWEVGLFTLISIWLAGFGLKG